MELPAVRLYILIGIISGLFLTVQASADEERLVGDLFKDAGYNRLIRPVEHQNEKVTVNFGVALMQLIDVDERNQIMITNSWIRMEWYDYQLVWDPNDYGGITDIRIAPNIVWKPDIVLFNNADGKYEVSYEPNVILMHEGRLTWVPPAVYKSSCIINVAYFPFDEQKCEMKFGSWTFNGDQVDLGWYEDWDFVDLNDYVQSGTWDIIDCPGHYHNHTDDENVHIARITFTLNIRRKTLFYTINLIVPCVLISFLSVCVFFLPADSGEKMTMCISILLALVVFMLLVSSVLPPTSITIPLIVKFMLFTFILNVFIIIITCIIININFRTSRTHCMPHWVRQVFLNYLPKALFMKRPDHDDRHDEKSYAPNKHLDTVLPPLQDIYTISGRTPTPDLGFSSSPMSNGNVGFRRTPSLSNPSPDFHITPETHKAIESVRFIAAHLKAEDDYGDIIEDWRYMAMVIDRLLLVIFLAITLGGTIGILINAPHIFDNVDQQRIISKIMSRKDVIKIPSKVML